MVTGWGGWNPSPVYGHASHGDVIDLGSRVAGRIRRAGLCRHQPDLPQCRGNLVDRGVEVATQEPGPRSAPENGQNSGQLPGSLVGPHRQMGNGNRGCHAPQVGGGHQSGSKLTSISRQGDRFDRREAAPHQQGIAILAEGAEAPSGHEGIGHSRFTSDPLGLVGPSRTPHPAVNLAQGQQVGVELGACPAQPVNADPAGVSPAMGNIEGD